MHNKLLNLLNDDSYSFLLPILGIDNFLPHSTSRLRFLYKYIIEHHDKISGNLYEFGVFRGVSLLAQALLLKSLNSSKKIYGFDSFKGFPEYHKNDDLCKFNSNNFSPEIQNKSKIYQEFKNLFSINVTPENISSSGDFSNTNIDELNRKIDLLELDNIVIVEGDFRKTIPCIETSQDGIFSANIDCDLYSGYDKVLPFVWSNLRKGGYVHLDEYYSLKFPGARIACDEFLKQNSIIPLQHSCPSWEFERWYLIK